MESPVRIEIEQTVSAIAPLDHLEREQIEFTEKWIQSGVEIFRVEKPATPDPHLVSYCFLIDPDAKKVLLTEHKKSGLWLPAGGHVEKNEHPQETAKRELREELGISAEFFFNVPFFITIAKTVGSGPAHTDISLWYALKGSISDYYDFDTGEFASVRWFSPDEIPYSQTDPQMKRCIQKLSFLGLL